jgi:hypothetical protein
MEGLTKLDICNKLTCVLTKYNAGHTENYDKTLQRGQPPGKRKTHPYLPLKKKTFIHAASISLFANYRHPAQVIRYGNSVHMHDTSVSMYKVVQI